MWELRYWVLFGLWLSLPVQALGDVWLYRTGKRKLVEQVWEMKNAKQLFRACLLICLKEVIAFTIGFSIALFL
jgi:hypothetical protein